MDLSPLTSSHLSPSSLAKVGVDQGSSDSPSVGVSSDQEIEPTVSFINLEPEEEEETEDMAPNLRVGFKERHCKRIFEALLAILLPVKKSRPEASCEESAPDTPTGHVPPFEAAQPYLELIVGPPSNDACLVGDKVPTAAPSSKNKGKEASAIPSS